MTPETAAYFSTADKLLDNACKLLKVGFFEDAGRNCYLSGMNAARGLLFEDGFQVTKRHKTLYGALAEALHKRDIHDQKLTAFLPTMAELKAIADYETGGAGITPDRAQKAVEEATDFVQRLREIAQTPAEKHGEAAPR